MRGRQTTYLCALCFLACATLPHESFSAFLPISSASALTPGSAITIGQLPVAIVVGDEYTAIAAGGTAPYFWTSSDPSVCAVDETTGFVTAVHQGTADIRVIDALGDSGVITVTVHSLKAGFADTAVVLNDTISIPLFSGDLTGKGVVSAYIEVQYDSTQMRFAEVKAEGAIAQPALVEAVDSSGIIRIALASSSDLDGAGVLLKLRFLPLATSGTSTLVLKQCLLNEKSPLAPTVLCVNGSVMWSPVLNLAPQFITVPNDTAVAERDSLSVSFKANDANGDPLYYSYLAPLPKPSGVFLDSLTGRFAWRPGYDQQGSYIFTIGVFDGVGGSDTAHFAVQVQNLNRLPVFLPGIPDTMFASEGTTFSAAVSASDDDGDSLSFVLEGNPPGLSVSFVSFGSGVSTGTLQWTPDHFQSGVYPCVLAADDGHGGRGTRNIVIAVAEVNRPPAYTTSFPETLFAGTRQPFSFTVHATDPDNDSVHYTLANQPPGMTMHPDSGLIGWIPPQSSIGEYFIDIIAADGMGGTAVRKQLLRVYDANRPPYFVIVVPDTNIHTGVLFDFVTTAIDPDGDTVSYFLSGQPAGMTINVSTGRLTWTPTAQQKGVFPFTITAKDKFGGAASHQTTLTIPTTNSSPVVLAALPDTSINEGTRLAYTYHGIDPDGDTVRWIPLQIPAGAQLSPDGVFDWTTDFRQAGVHSIIVAISDGNVTLADTAMVRVDNVNRPPMLTSSLPDTTVTVGDTLRFQYSASDPDSDAVIFTLVKGSPSMSVSADGKFLWHPSPAELGTDTVIVSYADSVVTVADTAVVTAAGFPLAAVVRTAFDFGTIIGGTRPTMSTEVKNNGITSLVLVRIPDENGDASFITDTEDTVTIGPNASRTFTFTFTAAAVGTFDGSITYSTNDPSRPFIVFSFTGTAISRTLLSKKILVDTAHAPAFSLTDSAAGMTQLFGFLKMSGFTVTVSGAALSPSGFDGVLIATSQRPFSRNETDSLVRYVSGGGLAVLLGDAVGEGGSNDALNALLADTAWSTGLSVSNNSIMDSSSHWIGDAGFPLITSFIDTAHPYLRNVDSLVLFRAAGVSVTPPAIAFARFSHPSVSRLAAIGMATVGKGRVVVIGDATMWRNDGAADASGQRIGTLDDLAFALNLFSVTENYAVKLPSPTPDEQYRLISIPFDLRSPGIAAVLKDLGEPNPLNWRLFGRFDPSLGRYLEYPSAGFTSFRRGEAYWLITRGARSLGFGNAVITPAEDFYSITIPPGYSLIGNPFPYAVSWKNSRRGDSVQSVLWKYSSKGFEPESLVLQPFSGYFVKNLATDSVTIAIDPAGIVPPGTSKATVDATEVPDEWKVLVGASTPYARDEYNIAGVARGAREMYDIRDVAEPPTAPEDYVVVRFNELSWTDHAGHYAVDIRPFDRTDGTYWDFDIVASRKGSTVTLTFSLTGLLPPDFSLCVIDRKAERLSMIGSAAELSVRMEKDEHQRAFRLLAGPSGYIERNSGGIPIVPLSFSLAQNFPNPFNPTTMIRYTLGHSGEVTIVIYNVLGQKVRTLMDEYQDIGEYSVEWDAKDDKGEAAASGVYFYKVIVSQNGERLYSETRKMVLMK